MKIFLLVTNVFFIFGLAFLSIIFQSTLFHQGFGIYKPNLLIIILTYLALNRFLVEGALIAYLCGYMVELNSGAPLGLYSAVFVLTFCTAKLISEGIFIQHLISQMLLVVAITLIFKLYLVLVLSMYQSIDLIWPTILSSGPSIIFLNFLLTPLLFFALKQLDTFCGKDIPTKTGSKEPEIELI